jgi:hypothetical protein
VTCSPYKTECGDGNPCTIDQCSQGECSYTAKPACTGCTTNADCETADRCKTYACVAGACVFTDRCNDNNACTTDVCLPYTSVCQHEPIPDCP